MRSARLRAHRWVTMASLACTFACTPIAWAQPPEGDSEDTPTDLSVERHGSLYVIRAQADVRAPRAVAWAVLTDYDHLAQFVPDMLESRAVQRDGSRVSVTQRGQAGFIFKRDFVVNLIVNEQPPDSIDIVQASGSFRMFNARYALFAAAGARTRVTYVAEVEPTADLAPPEFVGAPVIGMNARRQFEAVVSEIERRANSAPGATEPPRR